MKFLIDNQLPVAPRKFLTRAGFGAEHVLELGMGKASDFEIGQYASREERVIITKDEEPYYGEIPELQGVWATGKSLEGCRRNLAEALEDWLFFSIARGLPIPPVGGIELKPPEAIAS